MVRRCRRRCRCCCGDVSCLLCTVVLGVAIVTVVVGGGVAVVSFAVSPAYGRQGKPLSQVRLGAQEAEEAEMSQLLSEEECAGLGTKGFVREGNC